jgi:hypothetical protein
MALSTISTSFGTPYATVETDANSTGALVERLYEVFLGRQADGVGMANSVRFLEAGGSVLDLAEALVSSPEYANGLGQLDNTAFIEAVYGAVLAREPDPEGAAFHLSLLEQGVSRIEVSLGILQSPEASNVYQTNFPNGIEVPDLSALTVVQIFDTAFDRAPDEPGLLFWREALENGLTAEQLADGIAASEEFATLYGAQDDAGFLTALYANSFGREPDAEGLAFHLSQLGAGADRADVMLSFTMSGEQAGSFATSIAEGVADYQTPTVALGPRGTVGYYDMDNEQGTASQEPVITGAGATAVNIQDLATAELAQVGTLFVTNASNSAYGAEYLSATAQISDWVNAGGTLILHDRFVTDATTILPGIGNATITRSFEEGAAIELVNNTGPVANGPYGTLTDASLDNRGYSNHGFGLVDTLPEGSEIILTTNDPTHAVTFGYEYGAGAVVYSSVPLDVYLTDPAFKTYAQNLIAAVVEDQLWA